MKYKQKNLHKLTILFALLTLSVGLWAETQNVNYIDADGQQQTATVITNATTTLNAGWYVVNGAAVQTGSLTCNGAVHLILDDVCFRPRRNGRTLRGLPGRGG